MNFTGTKNLITDRCHLKKLTINDSEQLFKNVFSDKSVSDYMSWKQYNNETDVLKYLSEWQHIYNENLQECYWGIFLKQSDELVGTVYLYPENTEAELGFISYCQGTKYWGNGYMTESVAAVLKFAFNEIGYNNIYSFCAQSNTRSQKVLERLGFNQEALLRCYDKTVYGIEDCYYYSLLKNEFGKGRQKNG